MTRETIFAEWKKSTFGGFLNISEYWKQRALILRQPDLLFHDPDSRLTIRPLAFALRGLLLLSIFFSLATWTLRTFAELPPTPLDRAISQSKDLEQKIADKSLKLQDLPTVVPSRDLIANKKIQELSGTLRGLVLPIGLTLTAYLFRRRFAAYAKDSEMVNDADRAYLYWVTARMFWPNVVLAGGMQALELTGRFDSGDLYLSSVLNIWLFWICGIWSLVVLRRAAPTLSRILKLEEVLGSPQALRLTANNLVVSAVLTNIAIFTLTSAILYAYSALVVRNVG